MVKDLKLQFYEETDSLIGGTFKDHIRDELWAWLEDKLNSQFEGGQKYEVRNGKDGKPKIFIKDYNVAIAEFYKGTSKDQEYFKKLLQ